MCMMNKQRKENTNLAKGIVSTVGKQPSPLAQELSRQYENGEINANEAKEQYLNNLRILQNINEED